MIQGKCCLVVDTSSARARIQAMQQSNMGSFSHQPRWPQTAHFNPLHKPLCAVSARQMGGDYSNLAQSTSTSHVLTPFCHVWPPRQSSTSRPKKQASTRSACAAPHIPVGLAPTPPKCRSHIVAENAGLSPPSALAISVCL